MSSPDFFEDTDMTNRIRPLDIPLAAIEWIDAHRTPAERTGVELVRQLNDHFDAVIELVEVADEAYGEMLADSTRDGPRCLLLTRLEAALARCRGGAT